MIDKTKEQIIEAAYEVAEKALSERAKKLACIAMQEYADREKRKEAIAFLNSVTHEGCNNYFKIGDSWFLGEDEHDEDPEGPFTSEQLYDLYLQHIALVNKNKK